MRGWDVCRGLLTSIFLMLLTRAGPRHQRSFGEPGNSGFKVKGQRVLGKGLLILGTAGVGSALEEDAGVMRGHFLQPKHLLHYITWG